VPGGLLTQIAAWQDYNDFAPEFEWLLELWRSGVRVLRQLSDIRRDAPRRTSGAERNRQQTKTQSIKTTIAIAMVAATAC
jgi:hypothetical protein